MSVNRWRYTITANGKPLIRAESLVIADWALKARTAWHTERRSSDPVFFEVWDSETGRTIREMTWKPRDATRAL